ncbi:nuclear transport factor 2 family protein [uncultured Croceitalea sp.]|uniref:nuclear transport factor 2 family protein n=1 Tax=uncultured Croceitalea sp. TaxID=1798908 RepID=UPI003305AF2F
MKKLVLLLAVLCLSQLMAQNTNEVSVKRTIDQFYDGINERDSVKIKLTLSNNITYHKIDEVFGNKVLKQDNLSDVIQSIVAIPKPTKFELKNTKININVDGQIANVWTESQFYLYGSYYECGSSSFQLVKKGRDWKIISILDHYSKENCQGQN